MKLLDAKQVGELLGIDRKAVPGFVEAGLLEVVVLPGRRRKLYRPEGVERLLERCTVGPIPGPLSTTFKDKTRQISPDSAPLKRAGGPDCSAKGAWRGYFRDGR